MKIGESTILINILTYLCRKSSPDIDLITDLNQECEAIPPTEFECEPVEQLAQMEVDDIVISNDDELKSDKENDIYPIASDPYVESIEPKHFHEGMGQIGRIQTRILSCIAHPIGLQQLEPG